MEKKPIFLEADIKIEKETESLRETAASIIDLPKGEDKQLDLLYFSAIFVSSGENLNHAYFMPSELVKAEGTVVNKALDVEHKEEEIIGHIYERVFIDEKGNLLDPVELSKLEVASLDQKDMHIAVAGIIYKKRFPNLAEEVSRKQWRVSMEAYYRDYDVKVGDLVISQKEAEALGLAFEDDSILGRIGKVLKEGKEIAEGVITRVLRHITFSGCGIVKNPANPPSVILETAKEKDKGDTFDPDEIIVFDLDKLDNKSEAENNNVTSVSIDDVVKQVPTEESELEAKDTVGVCVSFKRRVTDKNGEVTAENFCSAYDRPCTSFSRDTTDPDCLIYVIRKTTMSYAKKLLADRAMRDKRNQLLGKVKKLLDTR